MVTQAYKGQIKETKEFKSLSRNNMETTLHVTDCKFHKTKKIKNNKN